MAEVPYPEKHIGVFEIGDVRPTAEGGSQKVKVKVRINPNGIFGVSSANLVEKHEVEEEVPEEMETDEKKEEGEKKEEENKEAKPEGEVKADEKMETGEAKPEEKKEVKMVKRKKVVNKNIDLPISQRVNGQLSYERLQNAVGGKTIYQYHVSYPMVTVFSNPRDCLLFISLSFRFKRRTA